MKKIDRKTPDLAAENVAKLAAMFPEVVKDGKVDAEALRAVIGEEFEAGQEKFGLTWPGKREAIKEALRRTQSTLRPQQEESVDWDTTQNLFIEGDNLEVLRTLLDTYRGKVKMIYIDPPYNTGNDFVYNDTFKEDKEEFKERSGEAMKSNPQTSGRYHSDWLSMMYPRLKLAKEFLMEEGVIFVSIDDNEAHNLRKLMEEVFGEENFVTQIVWENREGGGGSDSKTFKIKHEYILCFAREIQNLNILGAVVEDDSDYPNQDEHVAERGKYKLVKLNSFSIQYSSSLDYPITAADGTEIFPSEGGKRGCWRWSKKKYEWGVKNDFIVVKKNNERGGWTVYTKQYYKVDNEDSPIVRALPPSAVIQEFSSTMAAKQLEEVFGKKKIFDYSKPWPLIERLLTFVSAKTSDDLVLDFFAGSGTTAHAVWQLNAEDGGKRRFICVQLPEETPEDSEARKAGYASISAISKERIRRAGKKIREEYADKLKERTTPLDTGFKSFALDSSNLPEWDSQTKDLLSALKTQALGIKPDRSSEDVLYEVLLRYGVDIAATPVMKKTVAGKEVFDVGEGHMLVCLEENIDQAVVEAIAKAKPERVVFRDDGFKNDIVKLNAVETLKKVGIKEENVRVL